MVIEDAEKSPPPRGLSKEWIDERRSGSLEIGPELSDDEDENEEDVDFEDGDNDENADVSGSPSCTFTNASESPASLRSRSAKRSKQTSPSSPVVSSRTEDPSSSKILRKLQKYEKESSNGKKTKENRRNITRVPLCVLGLIVPALVYFGVLKFASTSIEEPDRFEAFSKDLRDIRSKFPQLDRRSWLDIRAGVTDVMNSSAKPWTFVFFSNETTRISCLAEMLGEASSKALHSENSLVLRPEDMGSVYGDTIDRLKPLIFEKKAVVVHDLLNVDPGAIQAFHTMCDRENPLVHEAIYILTIIAPGYTTSERPEVFVENLLTRRYMNRVNEDKLQPLITRLTDGPIIPVVPGNIPIECVL